MLDILKRAKELPPALIFHAYGGSAESIRELLDYNAYFSFAGTVLRPNYATARAALKQTPLHRLLVESDAPDMLPPEPFRRGEPLVDGEKWLNEPANIPYIVKGMADLLDLPVSELALALWTNASAICAMIRER